ncbi:hypothetical protein LTR86_010940 [Recurvomyces mirabilis]|nr:hypothetical protein LTR86_010940 [Recurvomyces mirabilis]
MIGPTTTYLGSDSAVHLSEELEDASYVLPRAMCASAIVNYGLGFVMTITLMFNLGDLDDDLTSATGQPWAAVIQKITRSKAATIVLIVVMIVMIFAFARDKGLPFHRFLSKVRPNGVPANSVYVTFSVTCLLALIIIRSTTAFNIILSVSATGLFTSYLIVIGTMLAKRLRRESFPASRFNLGILGWIVNLIAICFLLVAFLFLFFPPAPNPGPAAMNWVVLIYGIAIFFAATYYFVRGRREYEGPVMHVRKDV